MEQLVSHWMDFHESWYLSIFRQSVEKVQVLLKSDESNTYFTWRPTYIYDNISQNFVEWAVFQTTVVDKIKTYILCSTTFSLKSCRLRDNVEKYGTAGQATDNNIIRYMRFACWITKATDTLRICNTYCYSTATMVTRTRLWYVMRTLPVLYFNIQIITYWTERSKILKRVVANVSRNYVDLINFFVPSKWLQR